LPQLKFSTSSLLPERFKTTQAKLLPPCKSLGHAFTEIPEIEFSSINLSEWVISIPYNLFYIIIDICMTNVLYIATR